MAQIPRSRASLSNATIWHNRYLQQAGWTAQSRMYLYQKAGLTSASRVLEPGCGTGAILADCPASSLFGLDWDITGLRVAHRTVPHARLTCGNGMNLPYPPGVFDACICHFYLLWVEGEIAIIEMCRVTRPGGVVIALAEPDYGGRIDRPIELAELGRLQGKALEQQGADPMTGRKLAKMFTLAGLKNITTGVMGGEWNQRPLDAAWEQEWAALEHDLGDSLGQQRFEELRRLDAAAWAHGERILFVPTFYAIGFVPEEKGS